MNELIINGKGLYTDFDSYIAEKHQEHPKRKSIKQSIPFSNVVYDFSNIDGEIYYEERKVKYVIDVAELTPAHAELKRRALVNWLFNVNNAEIRDSYINGYHYKGTFEADGWAEDFDNGKLEVTYSCYPYLIADEPTVKNVSLSSGENTVTVNNTSSHPVIPKFTTENAVNLTFNGKTYALGAGVSESSNIKLSVGENTFTVDATNAGNFSISYISEVL